MSLEAQAILFLLAVFGAGLFIGYMVRDGRALAEKECDLLERIKRLLESQRQEREELARLRAKVLSFAKAVDDATAKAAADAAFKANEAQQ